MQIGIDLGGTKTEIIVLNKSKEIFRHRVASPRDSYTNTIKNVESLVLLAEESVQQKCSVGIGIPGTISPFTNLVKNANSTWLNNKPFDRDLSIALKRNIRVANDANCFAVSEASDGIALKSRVVFAFILGTGSGSGIVVDKKILNGSVGNAGEYGHTPLAWQTEYEFKNAPNCYCGQKGCYERWISGTGFEDDFNKSYNSEQKNKLSGKEIIELANNGNKYAIKSLNNYKSRLGRAIAMITNIIDPDIYVLGGGMSNVDNIYEDINKYITPYVFGNEFKAPVVRAMHGDSSGVRGAAWLWAENELDLSLTSIY